VADAVEVEVDVDVEPALAIVDSLPVVAALVLVLDPLVVVSAGVLAQATAPNAIIAPAPPRTRFIRAGGTFIASSNRQYTPSGRPSALARARHPTAVRSSDA